MKGTEGFAKVWEEAHRERSEYVWSLISRMLATPRRPAPKVEKPVGLTPAVQR